MPLSRRQFLATPAVAAAAATLLDTQDAAAQTESAAGSPPAGAAPQLQPPPAVAVIAANRMAYGPRSGDIQRITTMGLQAYVDEQLAPVDSQDTDCNARIAAATLKIQYDAGTGYPAVNENRALTALSKPLDQLWALRSHGAFAERIRPAEEVRAATWIRMVYSKWQLREVLVEFWHNHFNVNAYSDNRISATWPIYDRDVIRANSLGNFRTFLEAVAKSTAMLYYLDNASSKDGPANENWARELFELHTLGADHYFNALYDNWRDVPGADTGNPIGYIDEDVYEAARAFTGWTVADGAGIGGGATLPNTGAFHYYDGWHDNAQKRVLATEFSSNQPAQADGKKVLDLVAYHPGTAKYVCTKLCKRLVGDAPSEALVQAAVDVWIANKTAPDQIKKTVRAILLSAEFAATWGGKVKRPPEVVASFLRATNATVTPNANLWSNQARAGYRQFEWPTPTGHPDIAEPWLSTNVMLQRWNLVIGPGSGSATFRLRDEMPAGTNTATKVVDFWVNRILGRAVDAATRTRLIEFMAQGAGPDSTLPPILD
ncbi:MAG TPA: DUF1800 domain-containing protein, partial [Herpetosiphonaceae bacterium]